jgi:hypothetical protein
MIDGKLLMANPAYRDLYMKYLGTLQVLGSIVVKDNGDLRERIEACREDAAEFLKPRVKIYVNKYVQTFSLETA